MSHSIKDTDHGYDEMMKRLTEAAKETSVTVGIHEAEGAEEHQPEEGEPAPSAPATIAEIGAFHEFGLGVPRRSFIADWADEKETEHRAQLRKVAKALVKGKVPSVEQALERLGSLYAAEVQKRITEGIEPPLEQPTIDRKGSSVPLVNSGQLKSAITFKVQKDGEDE